jgi:serine/threonine protein kinase/tetratricopeptide (TPR) repeat protein
VSDRPDIVPDGAPDGIPEGIPEEPGRMIGRFRLVEQIGEGGFGVVWAAEQTEPVTRRVALKILKLGMDTRQVIARFEAERQALAMMDHPNIAAILDAGSTDGGRPYFAMELVDGVPLVEYCRAKRLGTVDRLALFVQVCHAIEHAHQKGVIHRDIKPSNVLVAEHDGVPTPVVIDFGIAKAIGERLSERTFFTRHRQMLGTPAYMSPEQASASGDDIDTRSDIYALGVLLYELITGTTPFTEAELAEAGLEGMLRMIREVDPRTPSTRLASLGRTEDRRPDGELRKLAARLRGDLDWIVMKCLEKDRSRRYDTAGDVAADIRRHLDDEAVVARPPSTTYRLRKFARRHRLPVAAGGVVAAALVLGVIGTSLAMAWSVRERSSAEAAESRARERAKELERVVTFQSRQLQSLVPERMGADLRRRMFAALPADGRDVLEPALARLNFTSLALDTLSDGILQGMIAAIDAQFAEQPLVRARLLQSLATAAKELGLFDLADGPQSRALSIRRNALGEDHPSTLKSQAAAGSLLLSRGAFDEAETPLTAALEGFRRLYGDEHPDTLAAINDFGILRKDQGRLAEAEPFLRQALAGRRRVLGDDDADTLDSLNNIGSLLVSQGRLEEAEPYDLEVLEGLRRVLGPDHPDTLSVVNNIGYRLQQEGRLAEAEPWFREALEGFRRVLGDEHQLTLIGMDNLGYLLAELGEFEAAETLQREALAGYRRVLGEDHPATLNSLNLMGALLLQQGRIAEAEPYFLQSLEGARRTLGDGHPTTLSALNSVAIALLRQEEYERAEPRFREAAAGHRAVNGDQHPQTLIAISNLSMVLSRLGRGEEALVLAEEAIAGGATVFGPESFPYGNFLGKRGSALQTLGRFDEAADAMLEAHAILVAAIGEEHEQSRRVAADLAELYDAWHAAAPADGHDAEAAAWRDRLRGASTAGR